MHNKPQFIHHFWKGNKALSIFVLMNQNHLNTEHILYLTSHVENTVQPHEFHVKAAFVIVLAVYSSQTYPLLTECFFPGTELSKSVPGNSDLWVFTLCGKGLLLHQLRPKVWWKLGSFTGDLSPLVSWRWLFGAVCVWTINLHQAPAQTGTDRKYTVSV